VSLTARRKGENTGALKRESGSLQVRLDVDRGRPDVGIRAHAEGDQGLSGKYGGRTRRAVMQASSPRCTAGLALRSQHGTDLVPGTNKQRKTYPRSGSLMKGIRWVEDGGVYGPSPGACFCDSRMRKEKTNGPRLPLLTLQQVTPRTGERDLYRHKKRFPLFVV